MSSLLTTKIKEDAVKQLPLVQKARSLQKSSLVTLGESTFNVQPETEEDNLRLFDFFKSAWTVLEPGRRFAENWHQELICEYLEVVSSGEIKRLLINIPPRHLKSSIVTIAWPCWEWRSQPWLRHLFLSYSARLSNKHSVKRRNLILSNWYQDNWGNSFTLAKDNNQKTEFSNSRQGQMFASSFGGTVTGEGGDRLIMDDPHDPENAESDLQRTKTVEDFDDYTVTRLNDPQEGVVVVVMQRLHDKDISGHILADIGGYEHLCLPTECETPEVLYFPISGRSVVRSPDENYPDLDYSSNQITKAGRLLHPNRFGEKEVEVAKATLGAYKYASRHQQRPVPKSGGIIKLESFKRYRIAPHQFDLIVQSWDTAQKAKQKNDPWDCTTWGVLGSLAYLLDDYNQRMEFPEGLKAIKNNAQKWKPNAILIEDKSSGSSAIQQLRQDQFPFSIIPIMPTSDKETRASAESTAIEAGRVYLPEVASWLIDYEMEVSKFPFAQHDDRVDSTSQFLAWMRSRTINISADFGVVENARALLHPRKKY